MPEQCWEVVWGPCRLLRNDLRLFHRDRLLQSVVMTTCFQMDVAAISLLSLLPTLCWQKQGSTSESDP